MNTFYKGLPSFHSINQVSIYYSFAMYLGKNKSLPINLLLPVTISNQARDGNLHELVFTIFANSVNNRNRDVLDMYYKF